MRYIFQRKGPLTSVRAMPGLSSDGAGSLHGQMYKSISSLFAPPRCDRAVIPFRGSLPRSVNCPRQSRVGAYHGRDPARSPAIL